MPEPGGQGQGALTVGDGAVYLIRHPVSDTHVGIDAPEPQVIAERLGQGLGAAQMVEHQPRGCAPSSERSAQAKPEVDGLHVCVRRLWYMREGVECLLEISRGLTVG